MKRIIFILLTVILIITTSANAMIKIEGGQTINYNNQTGTINDYYSIGYNTGYNSVILNNSHLSSTGTSSGVCLGYQNSSIKNNLTLNNNSTWDIEYAFCLGSNGNSNTLNITSGSKLFSNKHGYIGLGVGANYNTVTINGKGSAFNFADGIYIGGFDDNRVGNKHYGYYNEMAITNGASVRAHQIRTYGTNTLTLSDATLRLSINGKGLEMMGNEIFSGTNTLILEVDNIADAFNRSITLATSLDNINLIDTFNVYFEDSSGILYSANNAGFDFNSGTWATTTGESFSNISVPVPTSLGLVVFGLLAFKIKKKNSNIK